MLRRIQTLALLFVALFSLSACGGDDDEDAPESTSNSSGLVGKWEVDQYVNIYSTNIPELSDMYNREEVEDGNGVYWEFTNKKVTVFDPTDLLNEKPQNYTYNKSKKQLAIANWLTFTVEKLTSSEMILSFKSSDTNFTLEEKIYLHKR